MRRNFQLRTRVTHQTHCSSLGGPLHDHIATTYGLNRESSLNKLAHYSRRHARRPWGCTSSGNQVHPQTLASVDILHCGWIEQKDRDIWLWGDWGVQETERKPDNLPVEWWRQPQAIWWALYSQQTQIGDPCNSNKDTGIHVIHTTLVQLLIEQYYTVQVVQYNTTKCSTMHFSSVSLLSSCQNVVPR